MASKSYTDIGASQRPDSPTGSNKSERDVGAVQTQAGSGSSVTGPLSGDSRLLNSSLVAGRLVT